MNNALEDIVEAYLRRIEGCKLVEQNVFMETGELDAIGIDPVKKRIIVCEATASFNAYGPDCVTKLKAKFGRAEKYVKDHLSWLGFQKIEGQFWAPNVSKDQRVAIAQSTELKNVTVVYAEEYFQRVARLRDALDGADQKSLNPTCQLIALDQALKNKQKNRQAYAKKAARSAEKQAVPLPPVG